MCDFVPYRPNMAPELLAVWHAAFGDRHPVLPALWAAATTGDPGYRDEDLLVAAIEGRPVGFALTKRWRGEFPGCERYAGMGHVALMAVTPEFQRQGIGSRLLERAEATLRAAEATEVHLGGGFHHVMPGIPLAAERALAFAEAHGYRLGGTVWDVRRNLVEGSPLPAVTVPEGTALRPFATHEGAKLATFLQQAFPGRWARDVAWFLDHGGLPETVMGAFVGGEPIGFAWLHEPGSAGALRWTGLVPGIGALGPIGVAASHRGQGLGLALLVRGLEHLRQQGVTDMVIDWTDLLDFYDRCGFAPWLGYRMARKDLA